MSQRTSHSWSIVVILFHTLLLAVTTKTTTSFGTDPQPEECALWLAPSYTGTEQRPKYGIYAGRSYPANSTLPLPELAIPIIDLIGVANLDSSFGHLEQQQQQQQISRILEFIKSHSWTSEVVPEAAWEGWLSSPLLIPGIGSLPQYHSGIANVDFQPQPIRPARQPLVPKPGTPHPSRGAMTPYDHISIRSTTAIPAGMELFANFGDVWDGNYTQDEYQDTFRRHDYEVADEILQVLLDYYNQQFPNDLNASSASDQSLSLQEDILDFILQDVLGMAAGKHAKTIRSLLPGHPRKLQQVQAHGGTFLHRYSDMIRSTEWLSTHGYCLDTIRAGPSKIPYAGRGAFATRNVTKGQVITISPMLHIANDEVMTMYPLKEAIVDDMSTTITGHNRRIVRDYDRQQQHHGSLQKQLLLNYCFGHPESSLLLFPLGSHVSMINHDSIAPNAYITWSRLKDNGLANQHMYQDYSVQELANVNDRIVVVMKVVALRDIGPNEEITMDYGKEWELAWKEYMEDWERLYATFPHPHQAVDMRVKYQQKPLETIKSLSSLKEDISHLATACFLYTRERPDGLPQQDGPWKIREWYEPPSNPNDIYHGKHMYLVDILERTQTDDEWFYNYTVLTRQSASSSSSSSSSLFQQHKVVNVPHKACTFVNRPYTSDIHLPQAFRHYIGIMDSQFPQAWRDKRH